jgi:hypothetical protein
VSAIVGTFWAREPRSGGVRFSTAALKLPLTRRFAVEPVTRIELA